jgi:hypothetical protein
MNSDYAMGRQRVFDMFGTSFDGFPGSDWGMEGCRLSADEVCEFMRKGIEIGHDYLEESLPRPPEGIYCETESMEKQLLK